MGRSIYELLNEVETDFKEYEKTELSSEEKIRIKENLAKEAANMKRNKRTDRRKQGIKVAAAAAAAVLIVGGTTAAAKGLFSDTIENLIKSAKGTSWEEEVTEKYTKIGTHSQGVESGIESAGDKKETQGYQTEVEDKGISIKVVDTYCDGFQLYYTATLSASEDILGGADWVRSGSSKEAEQPVLTVNGVETVAMQDYFEKGEDGTYNMMAHIDLFYLQSQGALEMAPGEPVVVEYKMKELGGANSDQFNENGENVLAFDVEGDWQLKFPVEVDPAAQVAFDINKEDNGIKLVNGTRTETGLLLTLELPDMTKEPYNDSFNDPDIAVIDENGKTLQWQGNYAEPHDDNSTTLHFMLLYDGQKDLKLEISDKKEGNVLATIPFQVPTE